MRTNLNHIAMTPSVEAARPAAGTPGRISESAAGERARRASAGALAVRCVRAVANDQTGSDFLRRRAASEVANLAKGRERSLLKRLVASDGAESAVAALNEYAVELEECRRLEEADGVIELARSYAPERADLALRSARIARLSGDHERAIELYAAASRLDDGDGMIARLAMIGQAAVADEPEAALARAIRKAVRAGECEVAAVGLEERARLRRGRGDRAGAARDLTIAAFRYPDEVDRTRVLHMLADLFVAAGHLRAARDVLCLALRMGDRSQRDHARARLHTVARDLGDQVGMRRWRSFERPRLTSLSIGATNPQPLSAARALSRWRDHIEDALRPSAT